MNITSLAHFVRFNNNLFLIETDSLIKKRLLLNGGRRFLLFDLFDAVAVLPDAFGVIVSFRVSWLHNFFGTKLCNLENISQIRILRPHWDQERYQAP